MNLAKDAYSAGLEMDMTPMIDCVFQLIIFFMLITDLSQLELEEIYLPRAQVAAADKPDPMQMRPVVNITSEGVILVKGEVYYDPKQDDKYRKLREYLARVAKLMPSEALDPKIPGSRTVPKNPLLIRADQSTPAKFVQKVMQVCASTGIQIWRIELAVKTEPGAGEPEPPGAQQR